MPIATILAHLHPMLVHFPIACLLIAVPLEWIALLRRGAAYGPGTRGLLICGVMGAGAAVLSGLELGVDELTSGYGDESKALMESHKLMGIIGACCALVTVLFGEVHRRRQRPATKWVYLAFLHAAAVFIAIAGKAGGALHWGVEWLPW